jgi:hypothetical protein
MSNQHMNVLFMDVVEATEEAVYNSLFKATPVTGYAWHTHEAIPIDKVIEICRKYYTLNLQQTTATRYLPVKKGIMSEYLNGINRFRRLICRLHLSALT